MRSAFSSQRTVEPRMRTLAIALLSLLTGIALHAIVLAPHGSSRPAAATDDRQPAAPPPPVTANRPRAQRIEHGVPAGFPRTRDGAIQAAAAFVCTGQAIADMDPLSAEQAVRQMAATTTADQQVSETLTMVQSARSTLASGTGPIIYRQAAVAWRVDSYTADRARVAIWSVGVLARDGVAPPQAGWATSTFHLVWQRDDWKVEREVVVPGPAPILDNSAAPATASQLIASLDRFTDFGAAR